MPPMRLLALWLLLVVAALGCAAPSPVIPTPCDPACAPGYQCLAGGCYAPADGGPTDGPQDAPQGPEGGSDGPTVPDAAPDALPGPPDAPDGGVGDVGPPPCDPGTVECDGNRANGCERIDTDPNHCGRCGNSCAALPHSTRVCSNRVCDYVCEANFGDCDRDSSNGCEADTRRDDRNCGACGHACPPTHACNAGACVNVTSPGCPATCTRNADCGSCAGGGVWCCVSGRCYAASPTCP